MIWIHDTDATMISAFAFVGAFLDGENTPYLTAEQPFFDKSTTLHAPQHTLTNTSNAVRCYNSVMAMEVAA